MKIDEIIEKHYEEQLENIIKKVIEAMGYGFISIENIIDRWGKFMLIKYLDYSDGENKMITINRGK